MINLFNVARATKNIKDAYDRNKSPYQKALQEEKHYERMENNSGYRNMMNTFATTKKAAENTFSAFSRATKPVNNVIENFSSFVPKKIDEGLFDDENIVYQNMRGNGYSDQKAKEVIYGRRKEMLGGQEYLTSNEQKLVKAMKNEGHNSDEIFGVLGLYRQEQEAKRQAEIQAKIDEKNKYLSDARQGFMPGIDNDFQFHNTFGWLDDAGKFLQLKRENDDGFFESAGKMIANIPGNLLRTGAGIGNLASTAVQEGVYDTAAGGINQMGKMGAEYINNVGEVYNEAKNRKGIGQGILNATNKVLEDATNFIVDNPLDAMTIMKPKDAGTIYKGATKATIETGKIITKPVHPLFEGTKNIIKKYAGTPDEITGIQTAIRPRVTRKGNIITRSQEQINNDIQLTNGLIRASGEKPVDLASYKTAVKNEMQKIGDEINRLTGQDLEVDLSATIGKLEDLANSKTTQILDGGDGNKITALVENLKASKGKISVADAEDMNQWLNDTLKSPVSSASETTKRGYQILVADIRDALDNSISQIPGEFKEIKKAYGSLRNVYGDIIKREIVYNRQNPTGLVESVGAIAGAGEVVGGIGKIITGSPKEGFSQIGKGIANNAVGRFITHKNDPNTIIKNIFAKDLSQQKNMALPNIPLKSNLDNKKITPVGGQNPQQQVLHNNTISDFYKKSNKNKHLGRKDLNPNAYTDIIRNNGKKSNLDNKKYQSGGKDPSLTGIYENSISKNKNKSNIYTKVDGTIVEYKTPEGAKVRDFKKFAFKTDEKFPILEQHKKYISVLNDVQIGKKKVGIIGKDKDYGNVVIETGIYEKFFKKHGPTHNENIVATVNNWDYKVKNRGGQEGVVNYIKKFNTSDTGMLVGGRVNKNGVFVTTTYEPRVKVSELLKKEKEKGGMIFGNSNNSPKSYTNRNLDTPIISQAEAKAIAFDEKNIITTKSGKTIGLKQYSPHNISVLTDNSFKNNGKKFAKPNRLSGLKYSFKEVETGLVHRGTESINRIQISLRGGKLHLDDGRHLLQAYLELNKPIPGKVVQFTNSAKEFYIKSILENRKNKKSISSKINILQK